MITTTDLLNTGRDDLASTCMPSVSTEQQLIDCMAELAKALRLEHARLRADRDIKAATYALHLTEFQTGVRPDVAESFAACNKAKESFGAFCIRAKALKIAADALVVQLAEFRVS